jgi:MFS family permease
MVARIPPAAAGIVFVLRTKELTGSFAAAGAAAGAHALAAAACAPLLGRLVDRRGQPVVLLSSAVACAVALGAFALLRPGASLLLILPCAIVSGAAMPPVGACLRTLWPELLGDPARVHAAFAFEAAVLETTYIAGPVLIAGAIGSWSTAAAAVTCAVLVLGGTVVFATAEASRAWRGRPREPGRGGALRAPGVRTLAVVFVLIGVAFGAVEVAVPGAADAAGHRDAAGWLLGLWGLGSFVGGVLAARGRPPADRVRRLSVLLVALAVGHALLALPVGLLALAPLLVVAGGAIAPAFGLAYGLVDTAAPEGTVTEAFTWLTTGIAGGLALGSGVAGVLAEGPGAGAGFLLAGGGAACAAVFAGVRRRTIMPRAVKAAG